MNKTPDSILTRYEYLSSMYKQKDNEDFVMKSYFLIDTSIAYVFEYLNNLGIKVGKMSQICGYPVVKYKKDNQINLVLVLPMLNGEYVYSFDKGSRAKIDLDKLTDKFLAMQKAMNAKAFITIVDYYQHWKDELVESVMSPFGRLYLPHGAIMTEIMPRD